MCYQFLTQSGNDTARPKLGLILDKHTAAPASWRTEPPKWQTRTGLPCEPQILDVLAENLVDFKDHVSNPEVKGILERPLRVLKVMDTKEQILNSFTAPGLMNGLTFDEVHIPLLGYHWLDFKANSDEDGYLSMLDRGWQATVDVLQRQAVYRVTNPKASPYRG